MPSSLKLHVMKTIHVKESVYKSSRSYDRDFVLTLPKKLCPWIVNYETKIDF